MGLSKWHPDLLENVRILRQSVDLEDKSHFSYAAALLWIKLVLKRILVQGFHSGATTGTLMEAALYRRRTWFCASVTLPAGGGHPFDTRLCTVAWQLSECLWPCLAAPASEQRWHFPVLPYTPQLSSRVGWGSSCSGAPYPSLNWHFPSFQQILTRLHQGGEVRAPISVWKQRKSWVCSPRNLKRKLRLSFVLLRG